MVPVTVPVWVTGVWRPHAGGWSLNKQQGWAERQKGCHQASGRAEGLAETDKRSSLPCPLWANGKRADGLRESEKLA